MLDLDFKKLPNKYLFNEESLSELKFVDDNSLYVYYSILRGRHSTSDPAMSFLYHKPFEWDDIDFTSFLLYVSRHYGFEITRIQTNFSAITEEYEVSMTDSFGQPDVMKFAEYKKILVDAMMKHDKTKPFLQPKWYEGAYKWILDLREKEPEREEVILFDKFYNNKATVADVERLLIYANRIAPMYRDDESELYLSKDLFHKILSWTFFSIEMSDEKQKELEKDFNNYITAFIKDELKRNDKDKRIGDTRVSQSRNVYTFKKHDLMFREYLQKMQDDFGNVVTIENIFEDRFPNLSYPDTEDLRRRYLSRNFYFCHILFTYERSGLIDFLSLGSNWDFREDEMLTYQAKVEISPDFNNENKDKKLHFDTDKSRFYVQGKEIKVLKFKDEYHTLRVIFEDPNELSKEWFFSEIGEKIDESNLDDKKYYNAIYQLRLKLEKQSINDFFITTKQSVKINPKYLS